MGGKRPKILGVLEMTLSRICLHIFCAVFPYVFRVHSFHRHFHFQFPRCPPSCCEERVMKHVFTPEMMNEDETTDVNDTNKSNEQCPVHTV